MPRSHKTLPRLFIEAPLAAGAKLELGRDHTNYLLTVLRMKQADALVVFNGTDGAWMARILARFGDPLVHAAVRVGKYDANSERYLVDTLISRRTALLRRYLGRLSPIADIKAGKNAICGVDLARKARIVPSESVSFRAYAYRGAERLAERAVRFQKRKAPDVCVEIAHARFGSGEPDDSPSRYVVLDITNGYAKGPLRVHLYDLGSERGFRLAGIERPSEL